jgi:hypothetical protein
MLEKKKQKDRNEANHSRNNEAHPKRETALNQKGWGVGAWVEGGAQYLDA